MKYGKVYKLSDLFDLYLLGENGNEDLEIIDHSSKVGFSLNLSENIELKESIIDILKGMPSAKVKTKNN